MSNFEEASGAMEKMQDSEGALEKANAIYLESINAHVQNLKNAFTEMSRTLLSTDLVKFFVDLAGVLLKVVTGVSNVVKSLGGLKTILLLIASYVMFFKGASIVGGLSKIASGVTNLIGTFKSLGKTVADFWKTMQTGALAAQSAMGVVGLALGAIAAIIAVATIAITSQQKAWEKAINTGKEAADNINHLTELYTKYTDASASSEETAEAQKDLAAALGLSSDAFDGAASSAAEYTEELNRALLAQLEIDLTNQAKGIETQREMIENSLLGVVAQVQQLGWDPFDFGSLYSSSQWNLEGILPRLGQFRDRLAEIKKEFGANSKEYEGALGIYEALTNRIGDYGERLESFNESITKITFIKSADIIKKYTDTGVEGFKELRQELINAVVENEEFIGSEEDAAAAVDKFLSASDDYKDFYSDLIDVNEATTAVSKGLKEMADIADGTSDAISQLDEVLKGEDYDTGMEKRVEYMKKLLEEVDAEHWGGQHYQALADYFNIDTSQSVDAQLEQIAKIRRYFDDADQGLINFLYDIGQLGSEYAEFDPNTGFFSFDAAHVEELASALGLTKDAFADLVNQYRIYTPPSEWMSLTADEVSRWMEADGVITRVGDTILLNREAFDELAREGGRDIDELLSELEGLEKYSGSNFLELNADTSSIESTVAWIREFTRSTDDLETKAAGIANVLSTLSSEQVGEILVELNLPDDIQERIISMLPQDLRENLNLDTSESQEQLDAFNAEIDAVITTNDGRKITITVTDGGTIAALEHQLNRLVNNGTIAGYNVTRGGGGFTYAVNATGTKHARAGLSLLGDEFSASGRPKPELVVSNGRAYLAGINGPVLGRLNSGDIVYTNKETRQILGNDLSGANSIPAFASGTASRWWSKATGSASTFSGTSAYSSYTGSSGSSSASSTGSGENWFEQQYELHNHYRKLDQETDSAYLTWLVSAWKKAYAEGIIELKDAHKYEEEAYELMKKIASERFEEEYKTHQHMVAMGQETDQDYYSWLEWRHQVAYANNEITLEEYWKYQEEVYKKARDLVDDYFNDINSKVSMLENANKSNSEIILWDEAGMRYVEEQIADLKKEGKDNNDSTVQSLQKTWWSYYNDRKKREESVTKDAKSAAKELVDYRIKMLKKELDTEKSNLNTRLKNLQDFYSKQKDLLQDSYDEDKYLDEQAKKRKAVSDLEIQLAQLEFDNSAWAQKRRLELSQQLLDAQKELNEFEKEHALEVAKEKLDAIQAMQEQEIQTQIDAVEKASQTEADLYNQALRDIQNGGEDLYNQMVEFNNVEGSGNPEDIAEMWDDAYTSLKKYKDLFGSYYKEIKLTYGTDTSPGIVDTSKIDAGLNPVKPNLEPEPPKQTAPATTANTVAQKQTPAAAATKADPVQGSAVKLKAGGKLAYTSYDTPSLTPASWVQGKTLYVQAAYNDGRRAPYHIGTTKNINDGATTWVGWVDKSQLEGYASGTQNALRGIHEINERGDEALFKTASGSTYRLFSGGEKVFSSSATDFLYNLSNNPAAVLASVLGTIGVGTGAEIKNNTISQNISLGDIIIQGNASDKTISEIRRAQRSEIDYMLRELNRLNKQ